MSLTVNAQFPRDIPSSSAHSSSSSSFPHEGLILGLAIPIPIVLLLALTYFIYRRKAARKYGPTLGQEPLYNPVEGAAKRRFLRALGWEEWARRDEVKRLELKTMKSFGSDERRGERQRKGDRFTRGGKYGDRTRRRWEEDEMDVEGVQRPEKVYVKGGGKMMRDGPPPPSYEEAAEGQGVMEV